MDGRCICIGPNKDLNIKGSGGFSVAKGEFNAGFYDGTNGMTGAEAELKGSVVSGKAEGGLGNSAGSASANVSGDVLYAEAKAESVSYSGGPDQRYGMQVEASADAGVAKADAGGDMNFLGIVKAKSKFGLSGGSAAIGGKAGYYLDIDDMEIGANVGGKIALALGLNIDIELAISVKPIWDFIKGREPVSVVPIPGMILSGCSKVLIG